jgi:hypothetical protein
MQEGWDSEKKILLYHMHLLDQNEKQLINRKRMLQVQKRALLNDEIEINRITEKEYIDLWLKYNARFEGIPKKGKKRLKSKRRSLELVLHHFNTLKHERSNLYR